MVLSPPSTDLADLSTAESVAAFTRRITAAAFEAETTARQAHRDPTELTISGLGGCTRAAAYAIAGTPPSDIQPPEEARQALLGTWIHEHLLPAMAAQAGPGAVVEEPVKLRVGGLVIPGTLDLAFAIGVWDLKSVKEWRLHGVRRRGTPYNEHRIQVMGYAVARYQAGSDVKWVCWLYIDRSTGEIHVEVERFTNAAALAVIERVELIRYHSQAPDEAPREARGPGLSYACDRCPWRRRCWGDDAEPGVKGPQKQIAATPEGIETALRLYAEGAAMASAGERDKEFAKLILADVPNGSYGGWALSRGKPGEQLDQAQVAADYAARGEQPPKRPTAGRIIVKPVPQEA